MNTRRALTEGCGQHVFWGRGKGSFVIRDSEKDKKMDSYVGCLKDIVEKKCRNENRGTGRDGPECYQSVHKLYNCYRTNEFSPKRGELNIWIHCWLVWVRWSFVGATEEDIIGYLEDNVEKNPPAIKHATAQLRQGWGTHKSTSPNGGRRSDIRTRYEKGS